MIAFIITIGGQYWTDSGNWAENKTDARIFASYSEAEDIRNKWIESLPEITDLISIILWLMES